MDLTAQLDLNAMAVELPMDLEVSATTPTTTLSDTAFMSIPLNSDLTLAAPRIDSAQQEGDARMELHSRVAAESRSEGDG